MQTAASDADVVVYIGCGERGNEITEVLPEFPHLVDPRIRALMARVRPLADSTPSGRDEEAEVVRVHLHDGTTLEREVSRVDRLETGGEIGEKFFSCAERVLPSEQAQRVYDHALRLEELGTLEPLMSATRPSEP